MKVAFIFWDILHAITGIGLALVMLFLGSMIGLLFHPIHSIVNLLPALWNGCVTLWHAIAYLFNAMPRSPRPLNYLTHVVSV
ncbi:hypothetical protein [Cohnella sp.]|uniref:hypothetical protein n=1 Tax=Cohnella sp. TaxID=1883426 RepID=UPI00356570FC